MILYHPQCQKCCLMQFIKFPVIYIYLESSRMFMCSVPPFGFGFPKITLTSITCHKFFKSVLYIYKNLYNLFFNSNSVRVSVLAMYCFSRPIGEVLVVAAPLGLTAHKFFGPVLFLDLIQIFYAAIIYLQAQIPGSADDKISMISYHSQCLN